MILSYLQNHYDLEEVKDGYRFLTDNNVEYYLTFIEYPVFVSLLYSSTNFNHRHLVKAFQTLIDNNFYC